MDRRCDQQFANWLPREAEEVMGSFVQLQSDDDGTPGEIALFLVAYLPYVPLIYRSIDELEGHASHVGPGVHVGRCDSFWRNEAIS